MLSLFYQSYKCHIIGAKIWHNCYEKTPKYIFAFQSFLKSSRPSDAYMHRQPSASLVQIMPWCLFGTKPLSEPMLSYIVNWTFRNKLQWNFDQNLNIFIQEIAFENAICEMAAILSRPQYVNSEVVKVADILLHEDKGSLSHRVNIVAADDLATRHMLPGHQQPLYYPSSPVIFSLSSRKVNNTKYNQTLTMTGTLCSDC